LVLVSGIHSGNEETGCFDSVSFSNPMFNEHAINGFANVEASNAGAGYRTVKGFFPSLCVSDSSYPNFSASVVKIFDPEAYAKLQSRKHENEVINWRGHYDKFYALDYDDVLNEKFDLSFIKGKIVLMGYIGQSLGERDLVDIFFTPQNHRVAGRSYPDTYGVVVHANIISMILHENYISQLPIWATYILIAILTYLNISLFLYVAEHKKMYYDLITKGIQILEVIILMYLIVVFMLDYHMKVHLTLLFVAILLSGDLTELYAASLKPMTLKYLSRLGIIEPKNEHQEF
jgi:CHASE2 domain-containing sensor protein